MSEIAALLGGLALGASIFWFMQRQQAAETSATTPTTGEEAPSTPPKVTYTVIEKDSGSPDPKSDIGSECGSSKYTDLDALRAACDADTTCVGYTAKGGKPWCLKNKDGTTSAENYTYWKKVVSV